MASALPSSIPARYRAPFAFPLRQVHLDFHNSPHIPDLASEFDAREFAATFKRAHVQSVTVFAKCHHGMCYFPTKTGTPHPALRGRDLLGEMIEALHREDIRAPIYTTIAWDEEIARKFPQWRQMHRDGTFARSRNTDHTKPPHPGGWHFNDWINPDYQDLIESHVRELCGRFPVDGLFFDIVFYARDAHWSAAARAFRERHKLTGADDETFRRFESLAQDRFGARFTRLVRGLKRNASVFYNSGFEVLMDSTVGGRVRARHMTHLEFESLPSGFWGYYHFPRLARSSGRWGRDWLGMTGRFRKMWGDFGGIKPQPALEYECFRAQAHGGGNSSGDQLPPRGQLDRAAASLIGAVYAQCAAAEPFYAGSEPLHQIGVLTAAHPARDIDRAIKSDQGAIQMCEEIHYEASLLDDLDPIDRYALLILPDETIVTPALGRKLRRFHARGGKLIVSHHAGRDRAGNWALDFLPVKFAGEVDTFPTFWRVRKQFHAGLAGSDRVIYSPGINVRPGPGTRVLVDRVLPYFNRTDLTFSSHAQTPPLAKADRFPAVVAGENFVYFADPIFREFRQVGNVAVRDVWQRVMANLIGGPPHGAGLPTTVLCIPRRRGRDLILTLLHYVAVRKALELDVMEERMSFAGERLRLPAAAREVRVFGTGATLARHVDGTFELPTAKGRLLLEVPGFFAPAK